MKTSMTFLIAFFAGTVAAATPNFSMVGFATLGGGTKGGAGGTVVTPSTLEELKRYAEDKTTPFVIRITKEFNTGKAIEVEGFASTYGDVIRLGSNKTLVGIGSGAFFNRIGINIQCASNIIIRNIKFTMQHVPYSKTDENKIIGNYAGKDTLLGDPDCISIQADNENLPEAERISKNIWIDHCEFFNEDQAVTLARYGSENVAKDRYDGLTDVKNNSSNITISWCYYHDHWKASLFGKGSSDAYDRLITLHHNFYKNIASRLPLQRGGKGHFFNNYMLVSDNGSNARINADMYIEANQYENSKKPVFGKIGESSAAGDEDGAATFVNNKWITCDRVPKIILDAGLSPGSDALSASEELMPGKFKPTTYYAYKADAVEDVPALLTANAGVGKINTDEYTAGVSASIGSSAFSAFARDGRILVSSFAGGRVEILDAHGRILSSTVAASGDLRSDALPAGIYVVRSGASSAKVALP